MLLKFYVSGERLFRLFYSEIFGIVMPEIIRKHRLLPYLVRTAGTKATVPKEQLISCNALLLYDDFRHFRYQSIK